MLLHRKRQELSLGGSPEHPRHSRIQKSDDSAKHPIRSRRVPLMQPQDAAPGKAQHHGPVVVADDCSPFAQPQEEQSTLQDWIRSASPLRRCRHKP
jgi:hypothetical protein